MTTTSRVKVSARPIVEWPHHLLELAAHTMSYLRMRWRDQSFKELADDHDFKSESVGKANHGVAASSPRARRPHHELLAYEVAGPKRQRGARISHGRRRKLGDMPTAHEEGYWPCTSLSARGGYSSRDMQLVVGVAVHDTTLPAPLLSLGHVEVRCSSSCRSTARMHLLLAKDGCPPRLAARQGWWSRDGDATRPSCLLIWNFCLKSLVVLRLTSLKLLTRCWLISAAHCYRLKSARDLPLKSARERKKVLT
ncbi:hypothetical protein Dimus_004241 [Dionaea muscipula]